ncbi:MAG: hypothetical protein Q8R30_00910 [bacterium]|nr:hypothetical protein [bacterium]MDZ4286099.1 hypothetical protein [Candidatus Sungbacteria bacterium]
MGTYACWRLWAGFKLEDINYSEISADASDLLDQICEEPRMMEGLKVEYISLPEGASGGIGVVVMEQHWSDDLCVLDTEKIDHAQGVLVQLQDVFRQSGIVVKANLMHHIDLGG